MTTKELQAREETQHLGKTAVRSYDYNAAAIIATGTGKAKMLIDLAEELIEKKNISRILYCCDNQTLRDSPTNGFPEQLKRWGSEALKKRVILECYQTAYKFEDREYDLLLADEFDYALTPKYSNIFFKNKFKHKILVSGTCSSDKLKLLKEICPLVYKFGTADAEDRGVINKTKYYEYRYKMSEDESEKYLDYTQKIALNAGLENEAQRLFWTGKRSNLLYTLESSKKACHKVMRWLRDTIDPKIIVFCQRQEQADIICKNSFHGGSEKEDNLNKFQDDEIKYLSVVGKIDRGVNLKGANASIFESMNGSETKFTQKNGRLKRLGAEDFATVVFLNPYVRKFDKKINEVYYKTTIVDQWIYKATCSNRNIKMEPLKL